mgnify:CR=1 FL=1
MLQLVDSHAHIYDQKFNNDLDEIIQKCKKEGVERIFMPNIDPDSIDAMLEVESNHPDFCIPMMGLHPGSVNEDFREKLQVTEEWLHKRKFAAIGEAGLDLYWDDSYIEQQKQTLEIQIQWAKSFRLPIVLHFREAFDETFKLIEKHQDGNLNGVFHCFTGTVEEAKKITGLNFKLGIGGVLTFKKSDLGEVLKEISLQHLLLETDSPYLAPAPFRGKRNDPSKLRIIAEKLGETYQEDVATIGKITSENSYALFNS